jgi:hypothetical protein
MRKSGLGPAAGLMTNNQDSPDSDSNSPQQQGIVQQQKNKNSQETTLDPICQIMLIPVGRCCSINGRIYFLCNLLHRFGVSTHFFYTCWKGQKNAIRIYAKYTQETIFLKYEVVSTQMSGMWAGLAMACRGYRRCRRLVPRTDSPKTVNQLIQCKARKIRKRSWSRLLSL